MEPMITGLYLILIVIVGIVVLAGVGVVLSTFGRRNAAPGPVNVQDPPRRPAADVLAERRRSGDISEEEYQARIRQAEEQGQL